MIGSESIRRSDIRPSCRRLLPRVYRAACPAGARLLVLEEGLVERGQIPDKMRDLHFDTVNEMAAFEAVPFEGVILVRGALRLDHEPDRACGPLGRMSHMRRQQEHLALL